MNNKLRLTFILTLSLLLALVACSHEHPLTDHQHEHDHSHEHTLIAHEHNLTDHEHDLTDYTHDLVAYPAAQLIWDDPGVVVSDRQPIAIGRLTYEGSQWILVVFSQPPIGLTVTDVPDPDGRPTIPISRWHVEKRSLKILAYCTNETANAGVGGIAVRLQWHSGGALLRYACGDWPRERDLH